MPNNKPKRAPSTTRNGMIIRGSGTSAREKPVRKKSLADKKPKPGEPKNRRMTVARRRKVQSMRNSKNATALNKNIRRQQRPRPY